VDPAIEHRRQAQAHDAHFEPQLELWRARGRAAFNEAPERPVAAAMKAHGVAVGHRFFSTFLHAWEDALREHERQLSSRGKRALDVRRRAAAHDHLKALQEQLR
jgi:hypothetical protein